MPLNSGSPGAGWGQVAASSYSGPGAEATIGQPPGAAQPQETGPSLAGALAALPDVEEARPTNRGATYLAHQDRRIALLEYEIGLLKQKQ